MCANEDMCYNSTRKQSGVAPPPPRVAPRQQAKLQKISKRRLRTRLIKASVGSPAREERRVRVSTWRDGIFERLDGPSMGT